MWIFTLELEGIVAATSLAASERADDASGIGAGGAKPDMLRLGGHPARWQSGRAAKVHNVAKYRFVAVKYSGWMD
ncbi:hypothetical protein MCOR27_000245 [Pyricularia oryzae]|uniref:Uncharacterized protein n=4 Tax=Pyricularia oryzae TaxID=318829 RepID=G4NIQ9_PYRO7|nr:uncharacterized protein MGG_17681 [Pyricularia oryzae 70-15]ELQ41716.1 hypothetical protein OOU_Y34scaffold00255g14 [Pyricularia oryzae Y34]KAH9432677.1 hypothetical protein MCOR02_007364 [Pyricularia oryzae]EHA47314.1 hypothetical protein MGG_17681 [Pyricularia oryzae 70-15]KAI6289205.1 hypothetical protein MCOR27_000245 [Pyricularia oryzae]KAI6328011.1 hypothetical protein MCOR29_002744 [Pyricularia oryzae]